jgi:hypothetical protein
VEILRRVAWIAIVCAPIAAAQHWEAGGLGAYGFNLDTTVKNSSGSATTGLQHGAAFGAFAGSNDYNHFGGEASYMYRLSDLTVSGGGRQATLSGHSQFLDFRLVYHFVRREAHVRPFVAIGGGLAMYTGTGQPNASQPLNSFVALTDTRETRPMLSGAAGVKVLFSKHVALRVEVRDYTTQFPTRVIAPATGASISGWMHNFLPMAGVAYTF